MPRTPARDRAEPFRYCLNTSTIRGQKLPLEKEVELAAQAGFHALEPWIKELDDYTAGGGSLKDLGKRIADAGLSVESAIGFFEWVVDDDARRAQGLEEARRNMEQLRAIGGKRIAAPPFGHQDRPGLDLFRAAERYHALCELGERFEVVPQCEVWGFSKSLNRLGEGLLVAAESGHPKACILADIYHLYKGGTAYDALKLLGPETVHVFHVNDFPALPRETIQDADRVFPGDGSAPLGQVFRDLAAAGFHGYLSLELFNEEYWKRDAKEVLETGLAKLRAAVRAALAQPPLSRPGGRSAGRTRGKGSSQ